MPRGGTRAALGPCPPRSKGDTAGRGGAWQGAGQCAAGSQDNCTVCAFRNRISSSAALARSRMRDAPGASAAKGGVLVPTPSAPPLPLGLQAPAGPTMRPAQAARRTVASCGDAPLPGHADLGVDAALGSATPLQFPSTRGTAPGNSSGGSTTRKATKAGSQSQGLAGKMGNKSAPASTKCRGGSSWRFLERFRSAGDQAVLPESPGRLAAPSLSPVSLERGCADLRSGIRDLWAQVVHAEVDDFPEREGWQSFVAMHAEKDNDVRVLYQLYKGCLQDTLKAQVLPALRGLAGADLLEGLEKHQALFDEFQALLSLAFRPLEKAAAGAAAGLSWNSTEVYKPLQKLPAECFHEEIVVKLSAAVEQAVRERREALLREQAQIDRVSQMLEAYKSSAHQLREPITGPNSARHTPSGPRAAGLESGREARGTLRVLSEALHKEERARLKLQDEARHYRDEARKLREEAGRLKEEASSSALEVKHLAHEISSILREKQKQGAQLSLLESQAGRPCGSTALEAAELHQITDSFAESSRIGEGAFGEVFQCSWHGTPVAVKRLHLQDSKAERRMKRSIDALSRLRHPNIALLMAHCSSPNCLVYEFVQGRTLQLHLEGAAGHATLSWAHRMQLATELSGAVCFMHSQEPPVLHRNLRPANVMLDGKGRCKLMDAGLVALASHEQRLLAPWVDEGFWDPMEASCGTPSLQADVYALGLTLLMLFTGMSDVVKLRRLLDAFKPRRVRSVGQEHYWPRGLHKGGSCQEGSLPPSAVLEDPLSGSWAEGNFSQGAWASKGGFRSCKALESEGWGLLEPDLMLAQAEAAVMAHLASGSEVWPMHLVQRAVRAAAECISCSRFRHMAMARRVHEELTAVLAEASEPVRGPKQAVEEIRSAELGCEMHALMIA